MKCDTYNTGKSGVALILVIGLLALMMVLAVAFSIYMRTERVAAGNFKNDVKTRQLLYAALNQALRDIDASVGTNSYPQWPVTNSSGYGNAISMTNGVAWGVLPTGVITGLPLRAEWRDVNLPNLDGRYAYLAVNCSGLLDVNHVGGADRGAGTNASEVQILNLSDVQNEAALTNGRAYLTQQELTAIGTNSGALRAKAANFVTYSAYPNPPGGLVFVGGDVNELLTNRSAIVSALQSSGLTMSQPGTVFTNLIDYVDTDFTPGNLGDPAATGVAEGPSVEPVWMFNEVYISNRLTFANSGSNYVVSGAVSLTFECIYPFVGGEYSGCRFNYRVYVTNTVSSIYQPVSNPLTRSDVSISDPPPYGRIRHSIIPVNLAGGVIGSLPGSLTMDATVYAWIEKNGKVVDSVTNYPVRMSWAVPVPVVAAGTTNSVSVSVCYECREPRMNHNNLEWSRATNVINTLGSENTATRTYYSGIFGSASDSNTAMYVANKRMATVGELGCLFIGNTWQTVRLYNHGSSPQGKLHAVLDYFTVDSPSNSVLRGRVHLGTRQREVMMAAYDDMPIDVPGAGANRVGGSLLGDVVDAVMAMTATNTSLKFSDLGTVNWQALYSAASYPGSTDLDRESFIRNVAGLLGVRQNYFIILLYAQSAKEVVGLPDRSVVAGVRAVAEIWRDPVKNAQGRNPIVVRSFKILGE